MSSKSGGGGEGEGCGFFDSCKLNLFSTELICNTTTFISMLRTVNLRLRRLCHRLRWRWPIRRRPKTRVSVHRFGRTKSKNKGKDTPSNGNNHQQSSARPIRVATFNAAMFSMAPAVTPGMMPSPAVDLDLRCKSVNDRPKSILKKKHSLAKSKSRVSINLPDDEISVERLRQMNSAKEEGCHDKDKAYVSRKFSFQRDAEREPESNRSVLDALREAGADIIALQNVKAEEEKGMKPLSDLAESLGMKYVFAESWAPEFGNAILSRWPIKQWRVQKIFDDSDFRNVLKATIEIPRVGVVNFYCTHLDHLDEKWRMKQINSILQSADGPHILAGGLNSLDETDYSGDRWRDIVKYHEEIGKPTPQLEVMKFLKEKQYVDAKDFAGECEAVVVVVKGQGVQGTCKYGTRVDYILSSPNSPYKFVPGTYGVISSKGTSDHHIVKVDVMISHVKETDTKRQPKPRVAEIEKDSSKVIL